VNDLILATETLVRERLGAETTGHDWYHTDRVRRVALHIAAGEEHLGRASDRLVIELAALLHDLEDWKFHGGDEKAGAKTAAAWLSSHGLDTPRIEHVADIIGTMSYKGAGVPTPMSTFEGEIVQDADRLDAIGAIGIARTFAYGAYKGSMIHDPDRAVRLHQSFEDYKTSEGTTINHFYEKLLLLHERLNTETGKRLGEKRHRYMEAFLEQFFAEWNGER
jgi:uncharacterized protein